MSYMTADMARLVCAVRLQTGRAPTLDDMAHPPRRRAGCWEIWQGGRYVRTADLLAREVSPGRVIHWPITSRDELLGEPRMAEAA